MPIRVVDSLQPDEATMAEAAAVLRRGGVVAYPTETVYGLAVDPGSEEAVERLFALKRRDPASPVALIAADLSQAEAAGAFGHRERRLAQACWPGPLTIVVPAAPVLSRRLLASAGTIGVRVSAHAVARALARAFGACVTSTSANPSRQPPAITPMQVASAFPDLDLLLDGGPSPGGPPSTVVEIVEGAPRLHRAGAVSWDRVLESLE